ncbi:MAG TPA: hypothetical protein VE621_16470, partial [Bryobacteraceae bacterium]|nr:hypothetical protein [Bryobacteraceae bacterium]
MAEPIAFEFSARHSPSNSEKKLQEAPLEHAEALLSAMQLLQALHDRGVLSLLRGLVDAGDDVIGIATKAIDTPEAIRGIRNLVLMTQ